MPNKTGHRSNICERCLRGEQEMETQESKVEDGQTVASERSISELPEEVLQYILSLLPPYRDLRLCKLVCRQWHNLIEDLMIRRKGRFIKALMGLSVRWQECIQEPWPMVAARYSPATCYYKDCLYVFGGSTNNNTTFNDLWKFDLGTRRWIRPLVTGTYPTPKACSTLVAYRNHLILFGGLSNPPFYNFDQSVRFNNQVHLYDVINNNWTEFDTSSPPNQVAAHSATVHNNNMVIFGGHRFLNNSNEVWVLDLNSLSWWKPETTTPRPEPRFGQTQVLVDDHNLLIIGGCGGPNKILCDVWLLTIGPNKNDIWTWKKMVVKNPGSAAPHVWNHPGCKVEDHVVFLGKYSETRSVPISPIGRFIRLLQPERGEHWHGNNMQRCCSGSRGPENGLGQLRRDSLQSLKRKCEVCGCIMDVPQNICVNPKLKQISTSVMPIRPANVVRNTTMPSIKPNSMKNRQRQLEGCHRMEQRIRHLARTSAAHPVVDDNLNLSHSKSLHPPMAMYVLDGSRVIEHGEVEWTVVHGDELAGSPPDTMFYSIVYSEAEIIVFGGIRKESSFGQFDHNSSQLSNSVHILSYKPVIR